MTLLPDSIVTIGSDGLQCDQLPVPVSRIIKRTPTITNTNRKSFKLTEMEGLFGV